tara:strand:- start:6157 stop:6876 length:720 start_codon:yes stop_codon:yes gene_type:complete
MSTPRTTLGAITTKRIRNNFINKTIKIGTTNNTNNTYNNRINEVSASNQIRSSNYQQPTEPEYSSDFTKIYSLNYNNYVGNKLTIPNDIGIVLHDFSINLIPKKTNSVFKLSITINYNCSSHFNSYINLELKYKKTNSGSFNNYNENNNNNYINNDSSYSLGSYYLGTGSTSFLYNVFNASTMIQIPSSDNTLINFFIVAKIYNTQDDTYYDMSITDEYKPVILFDVPGNTFLIEEMNS